MSHQAVTWAMKQRKLKPGAKVVLFHLCDHYNPHHGCFPSLDTLADECKLSRRGVQNQIGLLVKAGLIVVEKMPRRSGQLPRNRYRLAFEDGFSAPEKNLLKAESAQGKNEQAPLANSCSSLGQNLPPNLVREPVTDPVTTTAREAQSGVDVPLEGQDHQSRREQVLRLMGCSTRGVTPGARYTGTTNDLTELPKWDALGLTRAEQDAKISEMLAKKRVKDPGFMPTTWSWFTAGMRELAKAKCSPTVQERNPQSMTREQRAARLRKIVGD